MRSLLLGTWFLVAMMMAGAAAAQPAEGVAIETAPGEAKAARMVKLQGTITAIDPETRLVSLKGTGGESLNIVAGPDVKNFAQLHVGDVVTLEYLQALALKLEKGSTEAVSREEEAGQAAAKEGAQPGGMRGRTVTIVAEVVALDPAKQIVTLRGVNGSLDLELADPEQFKLVSMGDRVRAQYVEAVAIAVEPVATAGSRE